MLYAWDFGLKCLCHCEDASLVDGGVVNEGCSSTLAGPESGKVVLHPLIVLVMGGVVGHDAVDRGVLQARDDRKSVPRARIPRSREERYSAK